MRYVYGCQKHPSTREEVIHAMHENPEVLCPVCHQPMHRIPQAVRFYMNPADVLFNKLDQQYRDYRARNHA